MSARHLFLPPIAHAMPNLHIIIGDANTRKSSLIRCLTGVGSRDALLDVKEASGNDIKVYCMHSALQEKPIAPLDFIATVSALSTQPTDVAFTLRVNGLTKQKTYYPPFSDYLAAFSKVNWPVVNVALLDANACRIPMGSFRGVRVCSEPNSKNQPTNQTASLVRAVWQWE